LSGIAGVVAGAIRDEGSIGDNPDAPPMSRPSVASNTRRSRPVERLEIA
jgi:hypothetical protein